MEGRIGGYGAEVPGQVSRRCPRLDRIIISNQALGDLHGIFEYVHERSPERAPTLIERVLAAIDELEEWPSRYKVVGKGHRNGAPIRSFAVQSLVIYYAVDEPRRAVSVLTVRHGRQRRSRRFE